MAFALCLIDVNLAAHLGAVLVATIIGRRPFDDQRATGRLANLILAHRALTFIWIVSVAMALGLFTVWWIKGNIGNDFGVYWRTANNPLELAYRNGFRYPFPYAPTMLLWIAPFAAIPKIPAFILWVTLSAGALALACRKYLSWPAVALVLICPALTNGLFTGQVTILLVALMLWACGTSNRYAAGVAFAIIASIKPQLAIMLPALMLFRKDWRAIGASALAFALFVAASVVAFGTSAWLAWFGSMGDYQNWLILSGIIEATVSPAAVAASHGLPPLPFMVAGAALGLWVVYRCRRAEPLAMTAAAGAGSLLASPYALTYDLAVIAPFLVSLIWKARILPVVALTTALPPLPILLTAFELLRGTHGNVQNMAAVEEERLSGDRSTDGRLRVLVRSSRGMDGLTRKKWLQYAAALAFLTALFAEAAMRLGPQIMIGRDQPIALDFPPPR